MKLRKKQVAVPKMEIDLATIRKLAEDRDDENWDFRCWLKYHDPDGIDDLVKDLSRKYFALIDCTQCGNCCRSMHVEFEKNELHTIAQTLGESIEEFQKKFMSEGQVNPALPNAERKAVFHLRNQTGSLQVVPSFRTTGIHIPALRRA